MENLQDSGYDSIVIFENRPICIKEDNGKPINFYGILYNKEEREKNDLFNYMVSSFVCYLQACEEFEKKGKVKTKGEWLLPDGTIVDPHEYNNRNLIYEHFRDNMIRVRYVEFAEPLRLLPSEHDESALISPTPLERYSLIKQLNDHNNGN